MGGTVTKARALLILVLPAALALVAAVLALAAAAYLTENADRAQARLQAALDHRPDDPVAQATALMVPGATVGLAESALQAQVLALVTGAEVLQIDARGVEAEGALTRLRLGLRLSGDEAGLMRSLMALEATEPLIFVDALRVTGEAGGTLTAEIDLSAYSGKIAP